MPKDILNFEGQR